MKPNQPIPQWVLDLPDDKEKEKRIEFISRFGSPSVLEFFNPQFVCFFFMKYV